MCHQPRLLRAHNWRKRRYLEHTWSCPQCGRRWRTFRRGNRIPLYAHEPTAQTLRSVFRYIFDDDYKFGTMAQVEIQRRAGKGGIDWFGD